MSAAAEILHRLSEIGATVNPVGDRLVVRAGRRRVPADLVKRLRAARADVLAVLGNTPAPRPDAAALPADDPGWWRRQFQMRVVDRLAFGHNSEQAQCLAWGELENRWHRLHGKKLPHWQCVGCGEPIGGREALHLIDGNRVHLDDLGCLIRYGERWRGEATRALVAMGLTAPQVR